MRAGIGINTAQGQGMSGASEKIAAALKARIEANRLRITEAATRAALPGASGCWTLG